MSPIVPAPLYGLLSEQYGAEITENILSGYGAVRAVSFRVNSLKADRESVFRSLTEKNIPCNRVEWYQDAFYTSVREQTLRETPFYENGEIYLQSLSSMLPPLALGAEAGESILDMTAAPGGKTAQISALTGGGALVTACEKDALRFQRLEYNLKKLGVPRVTAIKCDALKLDENFRFDRILLDAPCSGSGTFSARRAVSFSDKLLKNCVSVQAALLKKALKLLKKGGTLVYSTCSVLSLENDAQIGKILDSNIAELVPVLPDLKELPRLPSREGTLTVAPTELFEGFYLAKLIKK